MGTNYYLVYKDKTYHIGKSSCGMKFIFDLILLTFWQDELGVNHVLSKKVEPYIRRATRGTTDYEESIEPESISDLREEQVNEILQTDGSFIVDEYGVKITYPDFLAFVRSKNNGEDSFSKKSRHVSFPLEYAKYRRDFCIGSYIFFDGMNFF